MKDEPPLNDYCAIHWRAGDYGEAPTKYKPKGNPAHPRMAMNYYEPAMALFGADQKFLVFSDDIEAAKDLFGDRVAYSEGLDYLDDFRLMKRCKHFIISNSSYSLMAAILSDHTDKQVVGPSPWFGGPHADILDERRKSYGLVELVAATTGAHPTSRIRAGDQLSQAISLRMLTTTLNISYDNFGLFRRMSKTSNGCYSRKLERCSLCPFLQETI